MQLWKLGCRWSSGTPLFYNFIISNNIAIGYIDKDYQVGDWLFVTDGYEVLSFAEIIEQRKSVLDFPEWKQEFLDLQIPFDSNIFIYKVKFLHLKEEDRFSYPLQQGIVKVQGLEYINKFKLLRNKYMSSIDTDKVLDLIRYKKQIILQGPPGTGKTRLAKQLAIQLAGTNKTKVVSKMDKFAIQTILKNTDSIKTRNGKELKIVEFKDKVIDVKTDDSQIWSPSYNKIIESFNQKYFNDSGRSGGFIPYEDAIAKHIFDHHNIFEEESADKQIQLVQFHPSYSYEDFVRGIVAESKGDKIEYNNVNKILGLLAKEAKQNWDDSKKESANISKENKVKEYFEMFTEELSDKIVEGEKIELTPKVSLIEVEEDSFRYKGNDGWTTLGNRMLFKDIIQAFLDDNEVRQDLKKNKNLSGLAIQHATYYVKVLNMFKDYLASNNLKFDQINIEKVEIKNYVLIIDEINRANLSSVLGELIYALEYRGEEVESMYDIDGSNKLILPENLFIIGTMNTADRSVGHIDYAIRRRFAFVDVLPKDLSSEPGINFHKDLFDKVAGLFKSSLSPEFEKKDVQLGHSYFIDKKEEGAPMDIRLEYEIKPILREYIKDGILVGEDIKVEIDKLFA